MKKKIKKFIYQIFLKLKLLWLSSILGKDKLTVLYDKRFFKKNIGYAQRSAKYFAEYVCQKYKFNLVYDFGCGNGVYLKYFLDKGIQVKGFDGSQAARHQAVINKELISLCDLRKNLRIDKKADIVLCFEVAEHIEEKFSDILVKNLTANARDLIFFTAAHPGQGGTSHINEQPKSYWIEKFSQQGFSFCPQETDQLVDYLKNKGAIFWLIDNMMVFRPLNKLTKNQ